MDGAKKKYQFLEDLPPIVGWEEVMEVTGLSQPAVIKMMDNGKFDRWMETSLRKRQWFRSALANYLPSRPPAPDTDIRDIVREEVAREVEETLHTYLDAFRQLGKVLVNG